MVLRNGIFSGRNLGNVTVFFRRLHGNHVNQMILVGVISIVLNNSFVGFFVTDDSLCINK